MSGDRFEVDLRDVLREQAATAPVVLTLGELRARAGSRSRFRGWFGPSGLALGAAVVAIAVVAVAVATGPSRPQPGVGASPSATAASSSPAALEPSPSTPVATAAPSPLIVSYGPAGTAITAAVLDNQLAIFGVHRDGSFTEIAVVPALSSVLGEWHVNNPEIDLYGAISPARFVALRVVSGVDDNTAATALVDLSGRREHATILPEGQFAFLPDGTFVLANADGVTRFAWPYDGPGEVTTLPSDVGIDTASAFPGRPSITSDASGFYAAQLRKDANGDPVSPLNVIVHWDGSVAPADPAVDPLFVTGADRTFGADGQSAFLWSDDAGPGGTSSSGLGVEGPKTPRVETKFASANGFAWAPGGHTLVIISGGAVWSFDGKRSTKIATLIKDEPPTGIVGFTPSAVLIQTTGGLGAHAVQLDGSGEEALGGTVIGVVG